MNNLSQLIHQNNIFIVVSLIALGSFVLTTWLKKWTPAKFIVWLSFLTVSAAFLFWLQSPSASISQAYARNSNEESGPSSVAKTEKYFEFLSVEEIEDYLSSTNKPTLVEFYSDFGFS